MDILQEIGPTEQLIARGEYNYQVSGKDSGLTETWSLHALPEETLIHRAVVGGQVASIKLEQVTLFVMSPDYRPRKLEMTQKIDGRVTQTTIQCSNEAITQSITAEEETAKAVIDVPSGYRLFFPPVSAQGFILQSYDLEVGGRQPISLVSVRIQPEDALPLSVEVQTIEYERLSSDREIETPAGQFACHHFVRYDQHMEQQLWVDKTWIPIQWSVPYSEIMKWEYLLTRYQRKA